MVEYKLEGKTEPDNRFRDKENRDADELQGVLSGLPSLICQEAKKAVDMSFRAEDLDSELRGRLYIASTYFFLHLTKRHLELILPDEKARDLVTTLLKETGKYGYHIFFSQDIVPGSLVEYFYTFFESNFDACSRYLNACGLFLDDSDGRKKDVCKGFASWLQVSLDNCPEVQPLTQRLWEIWTTWKPFSKLHCEISRS